MSNDVKKEPLEIIVNLQDSTLSVNGSQLKLKRIFRANIISMPLETGVVQDFTQSLTLFHSDRDIPEEEMEKEAHLLRSYLDSLGLSEINVGYTSLDQRVNEDPQLNLSGYFHGKIIY